MKLPFSFITSLEGDEYARVIFQQEANMLRFVPEQTVLIQRWSDCDDNEIFQPEVTSAAEVTIVCSPFGFVK